MNIWSLVLALALIVILLVLPCDARRERFKPPSFNYGKKAVDDITSKNVKVPKNSIERVVFTKVRINKKEKGFFQRLFEPDTVLFVGNPKFISSKTNTVIVGKPIKVEADGKSVKEATANVNKKADAILNEIRRAAGAQGLMVSSNASPAR